MQIGSHAGLFSVACAPVAKEVWLLEAGGLFVGHWFRPSFGEQEGPENIPHFVLAARLETVQLYAVDAFASRLLDDSNAQ